MSLSHDSAREDQLVRHLLGLLTEQESEEIEELCITNAEMAGRLQAVENDLIDGYVAGTLAQPFLDRFEHVFLATPRRREKVRFAESLLHVIEKTPPSIEVRPVARPIQHPSSAAPPPRRRGGRWFESLVWPVHAGWGLAAATILLTLLGVLQFRALRLREELHVVQEGRLAMDQHAQELARQLGEVRASSAETARQLEQVRDSLADAVRVMPLDHTPEPTQGLASVLLLPQMRSAGPVPTLVVPRHASTAAFDLLLEPTDVRQFHVVLRDPSTNALLWHSEPLTAATSGRTRTVSIALPVRILKGQYYSFELCGLHEGGTTETMAGYAFRIVLR